MNPWRGASCEWGVVWHGGLDITWGTWESWTGYLTSLHLSFCICKMGKRSHLWGFMSIKPVTIFAFLMPNKCYIQLKKIYIYIQAFDYWTSMSGLKKWLFNNFYLVATMSMLVVRYCREAQKNIWINSPPSGALGLMGKNNVSSRLLSNLRDYISAMHDKLQRRHHPPDWEKDIVYKGNEKIWIQMSCGVLEGFLLEPSLRYRDTQMLKFFI